MSVGPGIVANFLHQIIAALDTGKYDGISVEQVEAHIRAVDLFPFLVRVLGEDADLSLFDAHGTRISDEARARVAARAAALNDRLLGLVDAFEGREQWGVHRNGLCLLLTYGVFMLKLQAAQASVKLGSTEVASIDIDEMEDSPSD